MDSPVVVSWDGNNINDGTNYEAVFNQSWGQPVLKPQMVQRAYGIPTVAGITHTERTLSMLEIMIIGSDVPTLRTQLFQWFDVKDGLPRKLVIRDSVGGNERYLYAISRGVRQKPGSGGNIFMVALTVDGSTDPHGRYRLTTPSTDSWAISATGETRNVTITGEDEAYPILRIKPTSNKTGAYDYKRWIPVRWRSEQTAVRYPVDIVNNSFDTAALTPAKMQADGDDLRVEVDGAEVDRWLQDMDTTTTQVWVNLDFQPKGEAALQASIGSGDTIDTIDVVDDISAYPSSGILYTPTGGEAFTYTGKNDQLKRFTGVVRAAKGTTAAAHTAGDIIFWVQHDIWLKYGNSAATAPTVDDNYKPIFRLDSTNGSWVYEEFGEDDGLRAGQFNLGTSIGSDMYTANRDTDANPWQEMGIHLLDSGGGPGYASITVQLFHPAGVSAVNFTNGEKRTGSIANWINAGKHNAYVSVSGGTGGLLYVIPKPAVVDTWEAWTYSATVPSSAYGTLVQMVLYDISWPIYDDYLEFADLTLTIHPSRLPTIVLGPEQGNYDLACTITNNTTGEAIELTLTMDLNEQLEVNTDLKTVTYLADDSNQFQALVLSGGVRRQWLPLAVGVNQLQFDDVGTNGLTIDLEWEERKRS